MGYERVAVVNGLRGFAILAVIYHHLFSGLFPPGYAAVEVAGVSVSLYAPLRSGWLGVNLFFVLSGFVLFAPYHAGLRSMDAPRDLLAFYRKRASRLLPLYSLAWLVGFSFFLDVEQRTLSLFALMATTTFPFGSATFLPPFNFALWSIGVEIWLSIAFPLLVFAYRRLGMPWLFAASAVFSLAVRVVGNDEAFYAGNPQLNFVKDSFLGRLDDLVLGMAIVCIYHRYRERRVREGWLLLSLLAGLCLMFLTAWCWDAILLDPGLRGLVPVTNSIFQGGCVLVMSAGLLARNPASRLVLANPVVQLLGMMCYSLYVWHPTLVLELDGYLEFAGLLLALSALTYRYVEFGSVRDARSLFVPPRMGWLERKQR